MSTISTPPDDRKPSKAQDGQGLGVDSPTSASLLHLHENMPDAFGVIDLEGRLTFCNRSFQDLVGYSAEELRQMTWKDLTPEKYRTEDLKRIEQVEHGGDITVTFEKAYRRKDGTLVPVELRAFPIYDDGGHRTGIAAVIRDITARKAQEDQLKKAIAILERENSEQSGQLEETRESFRRLAEATHEGIVVSHQGTILDCNERFATMVGRKIEDLIGRPGIEVVDPSCHEKVHQRLLTDNEDPYELDLMRPDGSMVPVKVRARMVKTRDRIIRVSAMRDVSESHRMENELGGHQYRSDELRQRAASLTPREREIVGLVAEGLLNKEIADRLGLALITVKVHRGRAMRKLKAGNAAELGKIAIMAGIFKPR